MMQASCQNAIINKYGFTIEERESNIMEADFVDYITLIVEET